MKITFLPLLFVVYGCVPKTNPRISNDIEIEKTSPSTVVTENRNYSIGDIDHDAVQDTAFIHYKWNLETNAIACDTPGCDITIAFKKGIPSIRIAQSLGVFVVKTEDVTNDKANEILIFSRTNEGWWNTLSVWTYTNKAWKQLAETDAFIGNDTDSDNRVRKENGMYYLIGDDKWNEDENGDFKKIHIKL
jgi:hypothetical protein